MRRQVVYCDHRSSSSRSFAIRFVTQEFVSPTWAPTSLVEKPKLIGNATFTIVQAAVSDSDPQGIAFGIFEAVE